MLFTLVPEFWANQFPEEQYLLCIFVKAGTYGVNCMFFVGVSIYLLEQESHTHSEI